MPQPPSHPGNPSRRNDGQSDPAWYPPPSGYSAQGYPPPPPGYSAQGYPPPPPGYVQPEHIQGGYPPPPPPPGYGPWGGAPGSHPPAAGPSGPPGSRFDFGQALNWSWNNFVKNAAALIPAYLLCLAALAIVNLMLTGLTASWSQFSRDDSGAVGAWIAFEIFRYLVTAAVVSASTVVLVSGGLAIADGKPVTIGSLFTPRNLGPAIAVAFGLSLVTSVGTLLCLVPGLVVAVLGQFALPFAIDRSLPPIKAVGASFTTFQRNPGAAILSWLAQVLALLAGAVLCGVGLIITVPLALLIQVYAYRVLSGGHLAPAA